MSAEGDERFVVVETADALDEVVRSLAQADRYAIDTEFHRERTYYPQLALIQIAWHDELVLIDPLAVDVAPLAEVLAGPGLAVLHASAQDLEVLELTTGVPPAQLFDTQVAAAFVGMRNPSLAALHDKYLNAKLPKANRLSDWLARPLEPGQLAYAASDVERLLEIHDLLLDDLAKLDRLEWALDECELARAKGTAQKDPDQAWLRIKEARSLGSRARAAARGIARWRELTAQERNRPVRQILPDLAVVALAQKPPRHTKDFAKTRGLENRSISNKDKEVLIGVIAEAQEEPPPTTQARRKGHAGDLRPAVTLIAAWMAQYADDLHLDPAMLGSRADIESFVRGEPSRLSHGWRHDLVGSAIAALLAGDAAVAFDGDGRVVVEQRSFLPVDSDDFADSTG